LEEEEEWKREKKREKIGRGKCLKEKIKSY